MLVVTRKNEQSIVVTNNDTGERIEFKILESSVGRAKLGIDAPKNYNIDRVDNNESAGGN